MKAFNKSNKNKHQVSTKFGNRDQLVYSVKTSEVTTVAYGRIENRTYNSYNPLYKISQLYPVK